MTDDEQDEAGASSQPIPEISASGIASNSSPSLNLGDRVVFLDDETWEHGTVRWIGKLQDSDEETHSGLELDNPVGTGTGKHKDRQLFKTRTNHATFVPLMGLLRENDFLGVNEEVDLPEPVGADSNGNNNNNSSIDSTDCQVCFERQANTAFYKCGHSSFCYECAVACKNTEPALCPICRVPIVDVLRLYK